MRLLLDSHVVLWWLDDNPALGRACRQAIADAEVAYVSVVSPWELGIKRALGRLSYPDGLLRRLAESGFELLAISGTHAETAPELPLHHRDPFDRMLIAQAQSERLTIATADGSFGAYDVELIDARI